MFGKSGAPSAPSAGVYTSLSTSGGSGGYFGAASAWWASLGGGAKALLIGVASASVLGIALGVGLSRGASSPSPAFCSYTGYRLPPNAAPIAYNLTWSPLVSGGVFAAPYSVAGALSVDVLLTAASDCVLLHAGPALSIASATVGGVATTWTTDAINDRIAVRLPPGGAGAAAGAVVRLAFAFAFNASGNNYGLYTSVFLNDAAQSVTMLATQFEATYARSAFPCFDEPALKARFSLTVDGVPAGFTALSNMPVAAQRTRGDGASVVTFQQTPNMSTYLLAFAAGPLVSTTVGGVGAGGIPVTAYAVARGSNADRIRYAAEVCASVLPFFEQLYGLDFPLPKMDMIAIPDFAAGAMENWGLITYRETAMLGNASTSSQAELQRVAVVVAHELAHQWNGDLVTMEWWNSLWLNEGFASRMEFLGTEAWEPGFGIEQQFQSADTLRALRADAFSQVQQLTQAVDSSAAVEGQFSAISYSKGAALLKCLQTWLAAQGMPAAFFAGVNAYLRANAYGAAQPASLWSNIAAAAGIPALAGWAQTYELQPGFPLVSVRWAAPPVGGRGVLALTQQRFFLSPYSAGAAGAAEAARLYWVPLTFTGGKPGDAASVLPAAAAASRDVGRAFTGATWGATVGSAAQPFDLAVDGFVKVGVNSTLYARVNYPLELWGTLAAAAAASAAGSSAALSATDRAALLDDYVTFALSGAFVAEGINATAALAFAATFMGAERSYEALSVFLSAASSLTALLVPDVPIGAGAGEPATDPFAGRAGSRACSDAFAAYARAQIATAQAALTWNATPGEPPLTTTLRASVLSAASYFGDAATIATARAIFAGGVAGIPPDLASVVLATVVRYGNESVASDVFALYQAAVAAGDSTGARRFLLAATASRDRYWLQSALSYVLGELVPVGDKVTLLAGIAGNPWGRDLAWGWLTAQELGVFSNWAGLTALFPPGGFDMSSIVSALAGNFQSAPYEAAVISFWGPTAAQRPAIAGALNDYVAAQEVVERAIAFENTQYSATCEWLSANFPAA